jgi:hypothetical protein
MSQQFLLDDPVRPSTASPIQQQREQLHEIADQSMSFPPTFQLSRD